MMASNEEGTKNGVLSFTTTEDGKTNAYPESVAQYSQNDQRQHLESALTPSSVTRPLHSNPGVEQQTVSITLQ